MCVHTCSWWRIIWVLHVCACVQLKEVKEELGRREQELRSARSALAAETEALGRCNAEQTTKALSLAEATRSLAVSVELSEW
jgi:hypothetical protein